MRTLNFAIEPGASVKGKGTGNSSPTSFANVALRILSAHGGELNKRAILDYAVATGLWPEPSGKTPENSLSPVLGNLCQAGSVVKVRPGVFRISPTFDVETLPALPPLTPRENFEAACQSGLWRDIFGQFSKNKGKGSK